MRYLISVILLGFTLASCRVNYYSLKINEDIFKIHPGENIEKVKMKLKKYQYLYAFENNNETLQYYCSGCGPKVLLITLRFSNGQLSAIEKKEVDSVF